MQPQSSVATKNERRGRERQMEKEKVRKTEDMQAGRWREKQYKRRREEKANTDIGLIE